MKTHYAYIDKKTNMILEITESKKQKITHESVLRVMEEDKKLFILTCGIEEQNIIHTPILMEEDDFVIKHEDIYINLSDYLKKEKYTFSIYSIYEMSELMGQIFNSNRYNEIKDKKSFELLLNHIEKINKANSLLQKEVVKFQDSIDKNPLVEQSLDYSISNSGKEYFIEKSFNKKQSVSDNLFVLSTIHNNKIKDNLKQYVESHNQLLSLNVKEIA